MTEYYYDFGCKQGARLCEAIQHNVAGFWSEVTARGIDRETVYEAAASTADRLADETRAEVAGKAEAAEVPKRDLLAFTLFEGTLVPDGCTTAVAAGDSAASGSAAAVSAAGSAVSPDGADSPSCVDSAVSSELIVVPERDGPARVAGLRDTPQS